MAALVGFFLLSIIVSFLCSVWEAVLLSITPSFIKRKELEAPAIGALIKTLKTDIDKPLSAILTLNTIAHTVGAIGVGAQAGKLFGTHELDLYVVSITYESLIATLMTLAILFASEIIPKTIGANNWKQLAGFTARSVKVLMVLLTPFIFLSTLITKVLKKDKERSVFSRQDFAAMAEVISESGGIKKEDYTLIKNLLEFDKLRAKDVMTPRTVMVMAEETQSLSSFYDEKKPFTVSRIPVFKERDDTITGLVLKDDVLQGIIEDRGEDPLSAIKRKVLFVEENRSLRQLFKMLNAQKNHLAIVVDEYGALQGLVTLEDIIETLFGLEILDETDAIGDLQQYARKKWEERAKNIGLIS